ncbi:MAG: hypothetical protein AAF513_02755 [Pseudomonadota bacterium]
MIHEAIYDLCINRAEPIVQPASDVTAALDQVSELFDPSCRQAIAQRDPTG